MKLIVTMTKTAVIRVQMPDDFDPTTNTCKENFDKKVQEVLNRNEGEMDTNEWMVHEVDGPEHMTAQQELYLYYLAD